MTHDHASHTHAIQDSTKKVKGDVVPVTVLTGFLGSGKHRFNAADQFRRPVCLFMIRPHFVLRDTARSGNVLFYYKNFSRVRN